MHIYDYLQEGEVIPDACKIAATTLIENDLQVVPIIRGDKMPTKEIKSVSSLKQHPINSHNVSFYFDRENVDIGIMLTRSMEVVDIDEKHYKGITKKILATIEQGWPELYEKMAIEMTPSGGAHLFYKSEIIGGPPALAYRNESPRPVCFIERIDDTNKNYIKTSPSEGYYYIQRSPLELCTITAEERGWLMSVLASFNEVIIPEVNKVDQSREDSPWSVFNKSKDYTYVVDELTDRGWEIVDDKPDRVVIKRPGSQQRHSGSVWKESGILYLFTAASEFEAGKSYSPFGVYAHYYHDGDIRRAAKKLAAEGFGIDITTEGQFWRKEGKKIVVKYTELLNWMVTIGYYRHESEIVQVINNRVRIADISDLKSAFLNEVEQDMADHFYERVSTIFSDNGGFMAMLPTLSTPFLRDDKYSTWFFFLNCVVKATPEGVQTFLYNQVDGLIWETSIIQRNYYHTEFAGCDADKFIGILGGEKKEKLKQIIGYALSRYKDPMVAKAVVLMEDIDAENEGESQGRSGKGLLFQLIRKFRNVARFDGKAFNFHDAFLWQDVEIDTDLILIDDVEKSFAFQKLFSVLTDGIPVNKKGIKRIFIPYESSPKVLISSNFAVGSMDDSARDRKFEFPVVKHFNSHYKPIHEFGRAFFSEWNEDEWSRFNCFMCDCAVNYLALLDHSTISVTTDNSVDRSLVHDTCKEFVEFMDDLLHSNFHLIAPTVVKNLERKEGGLFIKNAVNVPMIMSNQHNPDYYVVSAKSEFLEKVKEAVKLKNLSMTTLTRWVKKWAEVRGVEVDCAYKRTSTGSRMFRFVTWNYEQIPTTDWEQKDENPF